ncbi:MAG: acyl-CoA dehydrogenase family protein [Chloroflexota bacterium]|nr:acyl-CoA dehydrogenase family protein [Chloroflexota bacterium]
MATQASKPPTGAALVDAARALGPRIRAAADEIERDRRLPAWLVDDLKAAGIFRMTLPRAWGGPEADLLTQIRVIEELSAADGSVGWCAMIGSDGGYWSSFLEDGVGRELYRDLDAVTGSSTRPTGRAVAHADGFRVSGRWAFGSGCQHSTWMVSNCVVYDGEAPRLRPDGAPETRLCYLPMAECTVIDTWTTTGLRGTGSHDYTAEDVFVAAERTFNQFTSPVRRPEPLYALRTLYTANGIAVPLGIARATVEAFVGLAAGKVTRRGTGLRDEAFIQMAVARADSLAHAARAYVDDVMGQVWETLVRGDELSPTLRARYRLCLAAACKLCVEAVDLLYEAGGGSSPYAAQPLDRLLRDVHTAQQHMMFSPKVYEATGRLLLGLEPGLPGY